MKLSKNYRLLGACIALVLATGLLAWNTRTQDTLNNDFNYQDTIPSKKKTTAVTRDLDRELEALELGQSKLEALREKDWEIARAEVDAALRKIDAAKLHMQAQQAMKQVDFEKIQERVAEAMKKIDFEKVQADVQRALKEVQEVDEEKIRIELDKARKEVQESIAKVNWEKIRKDVEKSQKFNEKEMEKAMKKSREELEKVKTEGYLNNLNLKETFQKAHKDIEKAKETFKGYQEMIYDMEKEGLLSTKEDYRIEWEKGELFINRKIQPAAITGKYKKYFGHKSVTIKKTDGEMNVDQD